MKRIISSTDNKETSMSRQAQNSLEKTDPSEIERTYNISKQQSLFMRTNGKCNNSHAPSTGLSDILLSITEPNIPEGLEHEKNINNISMHG